MTEFEKRDRAWREYLKTNPGVTYAQYHAGLVLKRLASGHKTVTLGRQLLKFDDWWQAGLDEFSSYVKRFHLRPGMRVVDYGCGTLRVGGHLIRFLEPGNYFGLDVVPDYMDIGRQNIGEELVREKCPRLGVLFDPDDLAAAIAFDADFVYSSGVCHHLHPQEADAYFGNLAKLTHKPGATLLFDVTVAERRVQVHNFAWPVERYVEAMKPLEFVKLHISSQQEEAGQTITVGSLEFRRT